MGMVRGGGLVRWRWWPGVLAWAAVVLVALGLGVVAWLDHLLRGAGRPELVQLTANVADAVLGLLVGTLAGAVVASRRPRHPVGWLLLAFGLLVVIPEVAKGYVGYAVLARPGALPAAGVAVVVVHAVSDSGAAVPLLALALLLTPTGSLPSPRWRWVAVALVAVAVLDAVGTAFDPEPLDPPLQAVTSPLAVDLAGSPRVVYGVVGGLVGVAFVLSILAGAGSLVVRWRRARGVERLQLRWLALAAALAPVAALLAVLGSLTDQPVVAAVGRLAPGVATWLVPVALGAAVLRYRLYDLDRIVSRTVAYGLLTVILGLGYGGAVLLLGLLPGGIGGEPPSWAVAAATLAAAFQPARRRVQRVVDRRFDRHRYDAARTIGAFSARLRQQTDLDALTAELVAVVGQTVQPTRVSLWLRPDAPLGLAGGAAAPPAAHR
jgi:hypothetical protein